MKSTLLALGFFLQATANAWTLVGPSIVGWVPRPLEVNYDFSQCPLPEADLLNIVQAALDAWNSSQNTGISLTLAAQSTPTTIASFNAGSATKTPIVLCDTGFSANQAVDGNFVPAATRLGTTGTTLSYGGVVLNAESSTSAEISNLFVGELEVVLAHELGHVLGLGHSGNEKALMYYSVSGKTSLVLTQDDMDGISFLYPRNEFSDGPFGCASVHAHRFGGRSPLDLGWLLVLLIPLFLGRRLVGFRPEPLP